LLLLPGNGVGWAVGCVLLLGGYYAATDGVLMALTSAVLPERLRTTGLGLLTTGISLARLLSSILFGLLWTALDVRAAVATFAVTLLLATLVTAVMLHRGLPEVTDADPLAAG
jgi:MFS family permease